MTSLGPTGARGHLPNADVKLPGIDPRDKLGETSPTQQPHGLSVKNGDRASDGDEKHADREMHSGGNTTRDSYINNGGRWQGTLKLTVFQTRHNFLRIF